MHELSIAENILEIVRQYLPEEDRGLLRSVRLQVGSQAGIVLDSLRFGWEALTSGSPMEGAALEVQVTPYTLRCRACGQVTTPGEGTMVCGPCGSTLTEILGGTELKVTELEIADPPGEVS